MPLLSLLFLSFFATVYLILDYCRSVLKRQLGLAQLSSLAIIIRTWQRFAAVNPPSNGKRAVPSYARVCFPGSKIIIIADHALQVHRLHCMHHNCTLHWALHAYVLGVQLLFYYY